MQVLTYISCILYIGWRTGEEMKRIVMIAVVATLALGLAGCSEGHGYKTDSAPTAAATPTPAPTPYNFWRVQDVKISPMDGTKEQFISNNSYHGAEIVTEFDDGKLSRRHVGLRMDVRYVRADYGESYRSTVRVKFDDEKPTTEVWSITDSGDALSPSNQRAFLAKMMKHRKMVFEFNDMGSTKTVTFDLYGLADTLKQNGLQP
jgi:hypothetical protein